MSELDADLYEMALEKAELCIAAGIQPSEYDRLTDEEREAFVEVINRSSTPRK